MLCFGIVIFWLGSKNCIMKNYKWVVFPESQYANSSRVHSANQKAIANGTCKIEKIHHQSPIYQMESFKLSIERVLESRTI